MLLRQRKACMHQFHPIVMGAIDIAQSEVLKRKNTELTAAHLLYGLMKNPSSYSGRVLKKEIKFVENLLEKNASSSQQLKLDQVRPGSDFSQWITLANSHAIQSGRQEILEADLLRYLPQIFPQFNFDFNDFKNNAEGGEENEVPEFLVNLNELAEKGKLDPVIGRSKEIRAVMEILGRRGKNNPVLVGPAGVGKTAIVEGLAEMIVKGKVPEILRSKTVYSLDMGQLMAGTKFRGEFEERMQKMLKFIKGQNGEAILFIDEIHQLVGAGRTDGAMDAANLLKPALARGDLHCIGATTADEYQKYILKDSALDRRFRNVPVDAPSVSDAIEILMGIREKQEMHHGIKISDDAIYNAVILSDQYITDKNLPDKAIDLIDESASALKLSAEAMPAHLVEMESSIRSKMVLAQVEKNNKEILQEIDSLKGEFEKEKKEWEKEVLGLKRVSELKNQLDRLKFDLDAAERKQNYEDASRIKFSLIPEVEKELMGMENTWELHTEHVANIISRQTGIPLEKIMKSKQEKVLELEGFLKKRVFGQDAPLHEISQTLITSHAGLTDETRPLGSFLLLGPTGVGKTETVKGVAQFLFNSEKNIIRLDMSEFSEKHSVAKLIGAPAGYVGYEEGGVLTEALRRKPYSVVLFDEIEKAHPDFADILLQILDDGRLTDNRGKTVSFNNAVIFLTSNSKNIEQDFKPEVLGRLDEVLHYESLGSSVVISLVEKQLKLLNERLRSKKIEVSLDESMKNILTELGYVPQYGARPLQGVFNRLVIRPLSLLLVKNELKEGKVMASYHDGVTSYQAT